MAEIELTGPVDVLAGTLGQLDSSTTRQKMVDNHLKQGEGNRDSDTSLESIDMDTFKEHVRALNERFRNYALNFEVSDAADRVVVKVIDKNTGEVLRTIPPSEVLHLEEQLDGEKGWLVDAES